MESASIRIGHLTKSGFAILAFAIGSTATGSAQLDVFKVNRAGLAYSQPISIRRLSTFSLGIDPHDIEPLISDSFLCSASEQPELSAAVRYSITGPEQSFGNRFLSSEVREKRSFYANWPCIQRSRRWQVGGGGLLCYQSWNPSCRFALRYGTVFDGPRESYEGEHSVGLEIQFHFGKRKKS